MVAALRGHSGLGVDARRTTMTILEHRAGRRSVRRGEAFRIERPA